MEGKTEETQNEEYSHNNSFLILNQICIIYIV